MYILSLTLLKVMTERSCQACWTTQKEQASGHFLKRNPERRTSNCGARHSSTLHCQSKLPWHTFTFLVLPGCTIDTSFDPNKPSCQSMAILFQNVSSLSFKFSSVQCRKNRIRAILAYNSLSPSPQTPCRIPQYILLVQYVYHHHPLPNLRTRR